MSSTAEKNQLKLIEDSDKKIKSKIFDTHTEELVIGLCGPIGTDIKFVSDRLKHFLENTFNYICIPIKLSDLIVKHAKIDTQSNFNGYDRYEKLIDGGNKLRESFDLSILAELAINEITVNREINKKQKEFESQRVCYIIDSIKNKEELDIFRLIYRDIFYFIGVFSPIDLRVQNLKDKSLIEEDIYKLFDRDSGEEFSHGQMVGDTFLKSDFFLRIEDNSLACIDNKLIRFLNLLFGHEVITPTPDETAMYLASSAAGNSACLSRQVGACITDSNGEVISIGWNDVPKADGGVYKTDLNNPSQDKRCMNMKGGKCFNDEEKSKITDLLVNDLIKHNLVKGVKRADLIEKIKKSRIKELIEFSRAVHAEMLAIINGAQKSGSKMKGGKLYCTTYPCHNCARHIIAAGIKEVYYIEPYRKSLAVTLHNDAITEDEKNKDLVRILMYDGISPNRYLDFFKMDGGKRKANGIKNSTPPKKVIPKKTISLQAIPYLEREITLDLKKKQLIEINE